MNYNEFIKQSMYKIKIGKKSFSFRDASMLYLNKYENVKNKDNEDEEIPPEHLYHKSKKIIEAIINVLQKSYFELDNSNKIIFTNHIITQMLRKEILVKNSIETGQVFEYLRKMKIISKRSQKFPKTNKHNDVNQLTSCISRVDFSVYENILDLRDEILQIILNESDESTRELYLFYYLRLFSIKSYKKDVYENFSRTHIHNLNGTVVLIYDIQHSEEYREVKIVYFDRKLNDVLRDIFFNKSENLFDKTDHYFEKGLNYFNNKLSDFLKDNCEKITGMSIGVYKEESLKDLIQNQIQVEYQLYSTPVNITLEKHTLFPQTNYLELMKLFPEIIKEKKYEQIELENINKQRQHFTEEEEEDYIAELDLADYLNINTDAYIEFRDFKKFNKIDSRREYESYEKRLQKFIAKNKNSFIFPQMFYHLQNIISKSKFCKDSQEKLAASTIYGQLNILFHACFQIIIKEGRLDVTVIEIIEQYIDKYTNKKTKDKYLGIINPYLNIFGFHIGANKGKNIVYARKSLILKKELDSLFELLVKEDSKKYNVNLLSSEGRFFVYQRFIFCMLMYYSGLRESELWSRGTRDTYILGNEVVIDVNTNKLVKKFKTQSAKRRVEFKIDDERYFDIFKEYLGLLEERDIKYLFPDISSANKISKKEVQSISYFLTCNLILQKITGRYTSLHSFRHTYVTNNLRKLTLKKNNIQKKDLYNLVNMIGHLGPDVSLRYYTHIDYVLNYGNMDIF